jgi:hypothetical protein
MRYEWLIVEVIVLGLLVAELIALRRSQRRDRDAAAAKRQAASPPES